MFGAFKKKSKKPRRTHSEGTGITKWKNWSEAKKDAFHENIKNYGPGFIDRIFPIEDAREEGTVELLRFLIIGNQDAEEYYGVNEQSFDQWIAKKTALTSPTKPPEKTPN